MRFNFTSVIDLCSPLHSSRSLHALRACEAAVKKNSGCKLGLLFIQKVFYWAYH